MIRALPSVLRDLSFDTSSWAGLGAALKAPLVILGPDSLDKSKVLDLLNAHHYSDRYHILQFDQLQNAELLPEEEVKKAYQAIEFLISSSRPQKNSANGVFILIRLPGVDTKEHQHTLDVQQNAPPQRVFWWNKSGELPNFWFSSEGHTFSWPPQLNETNFYELDTKISHGGDAAKELTIFFITFGRIFDELQPSQEARDENILFASLSLPPFPKEAALRLIQTASSSDWHFDPYRKSSVLPLMTNTGQSTLAAIKNQSPQSSVYEWTKWAHPEIRSYFEKHIWPWVGQRCRITVLRTPAGQANAEHIDCAPNEIGCRQLKLRIVLQGQTGTLYFISSTEKIWIPNTNKPFLIDGGWPHGMHNFTNVDKYTICMGAPWTGSDFYPKFDEVIHKTHMILPSPLQNYFRQED